MRACIAAIVLLSSFTASGNAVENTIGVKPANPEEVVVSAPEPRYVAPTLRDRIGRIWAPV